MKNSCNIIYDCISKIYDSDVKDFTDKQKEEMLEACLLCRSITITHLELEIICNKKPFLEKLFSFFAMSSYRKIKFDNFYLKEIVFATRKCSVYIDKKLCFKFDYNIIFERDKRILDLNISFIDNKDNKLLSKLSEAKSILDEELKVVNQEYQKEKRLKSINNNFRFNNE